jgi:nucleoid DNA-binding protein
MDKPQSLSMREYLVRMLAVKLMMSEKMIDAVIVHQFSEANEALKHNDSIEISGFGKFFFNQKKAVRKMEKLISKEKYFTSVINNPETSEQKRQSVVNKLNNNTLGIENLKPRIYEPVANLRGMEEQPDSTLQAEGVDYKDK